MKIDGRPQTAVPPRRIPGAGAHCRTGLVLRDETVVHRRPDDIQPGDDQRIEEVIERVAEGRSEKDRPGRPRLVVVVDNLRKPLVIKDTIDRLGFGLVRHVKIAVVVVPDIFLVEPRDISVRAFGHIRLAHVPVRDQLHAVGIDQTAEQDHIVKKAPGLVVLTAAHLPDGLDQLLCAQRFSRVQPAVDPDHGAALARQRARLLVAQPLRQRQPPRDLFVSIELLLVLRRSDDRQVHGPPLGALAHFDDLQSIRFPVQLLDVGFILRVIDQLIIIADVEPELIFRAGQSALRRRSQTEKEDEREQ